jgi:hypothetical protein
VGGLSRREIVRAVKMSLKTLSNMVCTTSFQFPSTQRAIHGKRINKRGSAYFSVVVYPVVEHHHNVVTRRTFPSCKIFLKSYRHLVVFA